VSQAEPDVGAGDAQILCCPGCGAALRPGDGAFECAGGHRFDVTDGIPLLYWPNEWGAARPDVTDAIRAFYEETPFPNYEDFDSVASLIARAREGRFARILDDQIPPGAQILECGCGTGQLSSFLSIASRDVFATDLCLNSLRLGQRFKRENRLARVRFFQMNLFRPCFRPGSFDLVISNGVLHHTSDPLEGFRSIARLVRPGGYLLFGLYHRYGRLVTDLRRLALRLAGDRLAFLDPNLRRRARRDARWKAWFMDQYRNPHESKHTIGEAIGWLSAEGFELASTIPHTRPFQPFSDEDRLFGRARRQRARTLDRRARDGRAGEPRGRLLRGGGPQARPGRPCGRSEERVDQRSRRLSGDDDERRDAEEEGERHDPPDAVVARETHELPEQLRSVAEPRHRLPARISPPRTRRRTRRRQRGAAARPSPAGTGRAPGSPSPSA
jgi:SAM-dependent methyltransferase